MHTTARRIIATRVAPLAPADAKRKRDDDAADVSGADGDGVLVVVDSPQFNASNRYHVRFDESAKKIDIQPA